MAKPSEEIDFQRPRYTLYGYYPKDGLMQYITIKRSDSLSALFRTLADHMDNPNNQHIVGYDIVDHSQRPFVYVVEFDVPQ